MGTACMKAQCEAPMASDTVDSQEREKKNMRTSGKTPWLLGSNRLQKADVVQTAELPQRLNCTPSCFGNFDVIVIGAGPIGCHTATRFAFHGQRVAIVDSGKEWLGIPSGLYSKGLRQAAEEYLQLQRSLSVMGLQLNNGAAASPTSNESAKTIQNKVVQVQSDNSLAALKTHGIETFFGYKAAFVDTNSLEISSSEDSKTLHARCFVIATGSAAFPMPGCELDGIRSFTTDSIRNLTKVPKSIVISGGAISACEYATIYRALGSNVTVVARSQILREQDDSVSEFMRMWMEKQGITVLEGEEVLPPQPASGNHGVPLELRLKNSGEILQSEVFLWAGNRIAVTGGLNLTGIGILTFEQGGWIQVDKDGITALSHIAAVGDVVGLGVVTKGLDSADNAVRALMPMLRNFSHDNVTHGSSLSQTLCQLDGQVPRRAVPSVIWTLPGIAHVGLTEKQARRSHGDENVRTAVGDFSKTIRASVTHDEAASIGFLKIVFATKDLSILGIHIVGPDSAELIQYASELVNMKRTLNCLIRQQIAAVTYTEVFKVAALDGLLKVSRDCSQPVLPGTVPSQ